MPESAQDDFAFPPRRETFLARYPRNLKLAVTVVVFALLVLPPAWVYGQLHRKGESLQGVVPSLAVDARGPLVSGARVEADASAPALNDQNDRSVKLVPAPDVRVTEETAEGSLPRIGDDGARPWQIYARPFNMADERPRIAIVVTDLGLGRLITDQAIVQLPPVVTLSFSPQGPVVAAWSARARQDGHEILLQIPMEPYDYPRSDPGPNTLLSNLSTTENQARLIKNMRRASGYIGITTTFGSAFTSDAGKLAPVMQTLRERGLMVLDSRIAAHSVVTDLARSAGVPVATITQRLDATLTPEGIMTSLDALEKAARQNGRAVGITAATPLMISQLQAWMKTLPERGIALAPLSAMVQ